MRHDTPGPSRPIRLRRHTAQAAPHYLYDTPHNVCTLSGLSLCPPLLAAILFGHWPNCSRGDDEHMLCGRASLMPENVYEEEGYTIVDVAPQI